MARNSSLQRDCETIPEAARLSPLAEQSSSVANNNPDRFRCEVKLWLRGRVLLRLAMMPKELGTAARN